ncbi:MAG: hypothetical protein RR234_00615 [Christensenella sp.]
MLFVFNQTIDTDNSTLLWKTDFSDDWQKDWELSRGDWHAENNILTGRYPENGGALIYSLRQFPGDVMIDFFGMLIPPCNNDLNFTFRARGWNKANNDADTSYVAGLNGWWLGRAGIEHYPECTAQALCTNFTAEAGQEYHIQAGIIGNRCFIAVDGQVIIELADTNPIDAADCARVGLGVYASQVAFRDFCVYRPKVEPLSLEYISHF